MPRGIRFSDEDGCPDTLAPEATFAQGALDGRSRSLLRDVGAEGAHLWPGAQIRLVAVGASGPEEIALVRHALIEAGTPSERITEGGAAPDGTATDAVRIAVDGCAE